MQSINVFDIPLSPSALCISVSARTGPGLAHLTLGGNCCSNPEPEPTRPGSDRDGALPDSEREMLR